MQPLTTTSSLPSPTPLPRPAWHGIGFDSTNSSPDSTRFVIGNMYRNTVDLPVYELPSLHSAGTPIDAIFILSQFGYVPVDIAAHAVQHNIPLAYVFDAGFCAYQAFADIARVFDEQCYIGVDFEDFKAICGFGNYAVTTLSIGTGTASGENAADDALETAISLAGFGRDNRFGGVRAVFMTIAANSQTLRIEATKALNRALRAQLTDSADTLLGMVVDDQLVDGEFRVSLIVPV
jgi:FtsZ family, C-terminal domain